MADKSKIRMNLSAIKKVDPYAKDIVDSSSHVAFYTFSSDQNEWEKTDVEGAFFIYSRNAQPYHSIFINNRLNTTSFVEPITNQLELQSQPPFLLYRNERSRIRGFWFYNSQECDRISNMVMSLVQKIGPQTPLANAEAVDQPKQSSDVNIFKMLSKAQQEFNSTQQNSASAASNTTCQEQNVLEFFAAAKPTAGEVPFFQRMLPNTLSVEQLEKQQRTKTPLDDAQPKQLPQFNCSIPENHPNAPLLESGLSPLCSFKPQPVTTPTDQLAKFFNAASLAQSSQSSPGVGLAALPKSAPAAGKENSLQQFIAKKTIYGSSSSYMDEVILPMEPNANSPNKPALMPPTMFDKPINSASDTAPLPRQEPLNQAQLVQSFCYLMQNDEEFVRKLHEAYLKTFAKSIVGTYQ